MPQRLLTLCIAVAFAAFAAAAGPAGSATSDAPKSVTIAYQPGLSYAPLIVMKDQKTLEKAFPQTTFEWKVLSNGDAIRDGIIAGQIQIGAGGSGPFLIGWDRGIGYRLIGGLNEMDLWMSTKNPKIRTLKDITPQMKIGLPSPDSIQAIALRKAAQDQLGNPHALDNNLVAIQHPLGVAALAAGQLDLHFSSPPFQQQEVDAGAHVVFRSFDAFGKTTFNSVYTTESFAKDHPAFIRAFYRGLQDATKYCTTQRDGSAEILARESAGKQTAAQFKRWLAAPEVTFTNVPHGFVKQAKFMHDIGMLQKSPASIKDLELPDLTGAGD